MGEQEGYLFFSTWVVAYHKLYSLAHSGDRHGRCRAKARASVVHAADRDRLAVPDTPPIPPKPCVLSGRRLGPVLGLSAVALVVVD